ncbi:phage holin family protein [Histidinibacterium lentulum]|uniref:Phage holin family protein n=1 Tax=Histidinibacterium lentulum TaxID=2480588 RepID=A0A3N2R7E6_9RHOB|nr:phage holin family protein [Histidinibacterium lentulum]ROU03328.1 hypothetical protein EAT49_03200 [Histidinibacterium lentulum]
MIRLLISTAAYLIANAVGLLVAVLLLPGFTIDFLAFVVAVLIFSLVQTIAGPLVTKMSMKHMPQLLGGIALITIFVGLLVTAFIMPSMEIGGISNLLAATLLVWLGSLLASILLPIYVFKQLSERNRDTRAATEEATARANAAAERAERAAQQAGKPPGSGT